jgi:hypothetical protein
MIHIRNLYQIYKVDSIAGGDSISESPKMFYRQVLRILAYADSPGGSGCGTAGPEGAP